MAPLIGGSAALVLVLGGMVYFVVDLLMNPAPDKERNVQKISLVKPPPPPPPPETPPPPEEKVEEVKQPEPEKPAEKPTESEPDKPPLGEDLGLDAEGVAGSDAFGLEAKQGGRSLIGGGGGGRFQWYAGVLKRDIQSFLSELERIRQQKYSVEVHVWIGSDGNVRRAELAGSTGDPEIDAELRRALSERLRVSEAPPQDMPQPVRLRIRSRI